MCTYQLLKDFAGPSATAVAAIAAISVTYYFSRHQKKLAQEKLRLDLFDRRLALFSSIFDFYNAMVFWEGKGTDEQLAARARFFRASHEAKFLFKPESGIQSMLEDLNSKGSFVIGFKENPDYRRDAALLREEAAKVQDIQVKVFPEALGKLTEAIGKYVNFHDF